jgi:hypothetical protein
MWNWGEVVMNKKNKKYEKNCRRKNKQKNIRIEEGRRKKKK